MSAGGRFEREKNEPWNIKLLPELDCRNLAILSSSSVRLAYERIDTDQALTIVIAQCCELDNGDDTLQREMQRAQFRKKIDRCGLAKREKESNSP